MMLVKLAHPDNPEDPVVTGADSVEMYLERGFEEIERWDDGPPVAEAPASTDKDKTPTKDKTN